MSARENGVGCALRSGTSVNRSGRIRNHVASRFTDPTQKALTARLNERFRDGFPESEPRSERYARVDKPGQLLTMSGNSEGDIC
jgi:hypothetical protein